MFKRLRELNAQLPPAPWVADIDDPGTPGATFTGKFCHPFDGKRSATALYDEPELAKRIAEFRNIVDDSLTGAVPDPVSSAIEHLHEGRRLLSDVYQIHSNNNQLRIACVKIAEAQEHLQRAVAEIEREAYR